MPVSPSGWAQDFLVLMSLLCLRALLSLPVGCSEPFGALNLCHLLNLGASATHSSPCVCLLWGCNHRYLPACCSPRGVLSYLFCSVDGTPSRDPSSEPSRWQWLVIPSLLLSLPVGFLVQKWHFFGSEISLLKLHFLEGYGCTP